MRLVYGAKTNALKVSQVLVNEINVNTVVTLLALVNLSGIAQAQNVTDPDPATPTAVSTAGEAAAADVAVPGALERFGDWLLNSSQQRRQQLVKESRFDELADRSGDDRWRAAGQFRRGEYEAAAESYATGSSAQAVYNQATTLAHTGEYDKALELLDDVLAERPTDEDALHNKEIIEQLKDLAEQQQSQSGESGDEQQESDEDGENSDQQKDEGDQSEQSESEVRTLMKPRVMPKSSRASHLTMLILNK